jgi:hypothetical protein
MQACSSIPLRATGRTRTPCAPHRRISATAASPTVEPRVWQRPNAQQRQSMIEQLAYSLAERRGFAPGGEVDDWLAAEAEVDEWLRSEQFCGD